MRKWASSAAVVVILALLLACSPPPPATQTPPTTTPPTTAPATTTPPADPLAYLGLNPVETSMPIYGGTLTTSTPYPRSFDGHQKVGYGPMTQLPAFNQLVMFDLTYKGISAKSIIGDLAESWETSPDATEITFHLHQGVKWHDGIPFTADDVVYSMDKMTDPARSAISGFFPSYESTEKLDDYTVKIHLKYPSAGFMMAMAGPYAQMQAKHMAGTDAQSIDFIVGTGPFIITEVVPQVHTRWKRNPEYFKKDKYGNQLPYLDALYLVRTLGVDPFISRRLDTSHLVVSGVTASDFKALKEGAPDALWQPTVKTDTAAFFMNMSKPPLDDIRVRRAIGMVLEEENIIIGYSGDPSFGITDTGLLHPSYGLPKEEILTLMGWDKPFEERVTEAKKLLAEAGYPDGFDLEILSQRASSSTTEGHPGASLVLADALRRHLNINTNVRALGQAEAQKLIDEDNYQIYAQWFIINDDPAQMANFFGSGGKSNWAHYANADLDKKLADLDHVVDPDARLELIRDIERTLLTDLPALPTGVFSVYNLFYYPHVKNLRFQTQLYSNIVRLEDVWIDPSLKPPNMATE